MKKILLLVTILYSFHAFAQTPLKGRDSTIKGPQTFAIVMGISKYKYVRPLAYADKDAQLFKDYLKSPGGGSVKEDNIYTLLNEKANNANFWSKGFQWLKAKKLQQGDRLFIYLAGHGDAIDEDQFFFLNYDCNPQGDKNNYLVAGTIQLFNLKKKIANETVKGVEVFFIMDACRTSELPGGSEGQNFLNTAISEKQAGEVIMLATAAGEASLEDASIGTGHGLFTYYLVDGLNGVADTIGGADRKVTFREIQAYVDKNVPFVAQQRFKRKQDPFFCCTESSEKVISSVDTAYLKRWLEQKKRENRGGGNSFNGIIKTFTAADTLLVETYNRFNTAVNNNRLETAEDYFQQLNRKFPGNPYTLDAKSTLAAEFINAAQQKVDRYLGCSDEGSAKEKQANYQAALNLEKAIASVREDDADFANSLLNRMYFLKASGDFGPNGANGDISVAFQNAYAALRIDPNGAYIQNKLALLHLQNNNKDSALFYADKAVKTAPKWPCALTTLALIQKTTSSNDPKRQPGKNSPFRKVSFGITAGGGLSQSDPTYSGNANSGFTGVASNSASVVDLGLITQINLGGTIFIRPEVTLIFENTSVVFEQRPPTGGQIFTQNVDVKAALINIGLPFIVRFSSKNIAPYISLAPSFSYLISQDNTSSERLPVLKSVFMGSGGLGIDIGLAKAGLYISPELRYTAGFSELKDDASTTSFARALSSLKKNSFSLNVYLRKR
ncbi:MAG: outer membrane beta-barrel protein [Chitinophagaceae bacterium]|nr:outer membrane beta-barrel protein [Chitinophagaceae bacterium]